MSASASSVRPRPFLHQNQHFQSRFINALLLWQLLKLLEKFFYSGVVHFRTPGWQADLMVTRWTLSSKPYLRWHYALSKFWVCTHLQANVFCFFLRCFYRNDNCALCTLDARWLSSSCLRNLHYIYIQALHLFQNVFQFQNLLRNFPILRLISNRLGTVADWQPGVPCPLTQTFRGTAPHLLPLTLLSICLENDIIEFI